MIHKKKICDIWYCWNCNRIFNVEKVPYMYMYLEFQFIHGTIMFLKYKIYRYGVISNILKHSAK